MALHSLITGCLTTIWSYLDWTTVLLTRIVFYITKILIFKGCIFNKKNLPPGIFGVPIIGTLPYFMFSKKTTFETLEAFSKQYGPIYRMAFGTQENYIVNGVAAVKEALLSDDLLGRAKSRLDDPELDALQPKSLITMEGDLWKKHRRFSLYTLRDLGFGKTAVMENYLREEINELISIIEKHNGDGFDFSVLLTPSTSNNISTLVFGERLPFNNPKRKDLNDVLTAFNQETEKLVALLMVPGLTKFVVKFRLGIGQRILNVIRKFRELMQDEVDSHKKKFDEDNLTDYLDHYIKHAKTDTDFTDDLAAGNASAFFGAGSSTVRVTVEYLLHLMADKPEVADKVFDEIRKVVGLDREVTWADSKELPYTMAVITERHRYFTVAPLGVQRKALKDTQLCGMTVLSGSTVTYNLDSVHYDPTVFPEPYVFRPERFLDEEGKLCNTDKVWAFAIGKRACPGESLAVLEVFLYFANLMQRFKIEAEKGKKIKIKPVRVLISDVIKQNIRFVPR